jgi:peptidoglycan hydrolase-like protein with peptidoglycan-binding domain
MIGDLAIWMKLYNWWKRFVGILYGEVAPTPFTYKDVDAFTLQLMLIKHGYPCVITGKLDEQTRKHLKKFQSDNGLEADGLFGPKTFTALEAK